MTQLAKVTPPPHGRPLDLHDQRKREARKVGLVLAGEVALSERFGQARKRRAMGEV